MTFDLADYVDVPTRIGIFRDKYPTGSLQSEIEVLRNNDGIPIAVLCKAFAYRDYDDIRPGVGHSWMAIPGTTPYTRGSEVENSETSAWGRAIVAALAADTHKGVASADEVRSKQQDSVPTVVGAPRGGQAAGSTPLPPGTPAVFTWASGKHQGKTLEETPRDYIGWYAELGPKPDVREVCKAFLNAPAGEAAIQDELVAAGATPVSDDPDFDVPFDRTIDGLGN